MLLLRIVVLLAIATASFCQTDEPGCKDSPLITRFPGSYIYGCEHKEFDQLNIVVSRDASENDTTKDIEGELWFWVYEAREGTSSLQIFRNYQNALRQGGFTQVFAASPNYILARKGDLNVVIQIHASSIQQRILQVKAMQQEITVDAAALKGELERTGRVSVYGINFDTGKAAILPQSEKVLNEVLKVLEESGNLKVRIEGHTDNVGAKALNDKLSTQRAQAVMGWLIAHGIDAGRLAAQGFGDSKPVADNKSEEGRAKNRRVDLVRQ